MKKTTGKRDSRIRQFWPYLRQALVLFLSSFCIILLTSQVSTIEKLSGPYLGQDSPGKTPERFARGIIPEDLHSVPVFSKDGRSMYYKSMDSEGIMTSKEKGNRWTSPEPIFMNNELDNSDDPCLSNTGDRLFFSSYNKDVNRDFIYYSEVRKGGFSQPQQPDGMLNSLDLHWQFSMAGNGNIYYSSNGNIYCSEMNAGSYLEPYKLDEKINTELSECTPYISADENTLIFSRSVDEKPDLFICKRNRNGQWETSRALPYPINTEHHEMCPHITADGKYFFFISSREGLFSAYWVDANVVGAN